MLYAIGNFNFKKTVMKSPIFALFSSALRRQSRGFRFWTQKSKIPINHFYFASLNIFFFYLRFCLTKKSSAKRALIIAKFYNRHWRIQIPQNNIVVNQLFISENRSGYISQVSDLILIYSFYSCTINYGATY